MGKLKCREKDRASPRRRGHAVEGVVPMSVRVCDFDPRKTCLAELGRARKEGACRGVGKSKKLGAQL